MTWSYETSSPAWASRISSRSFSWTDGFKARRCRRREVAFEAVERFAFYDRAREAFAVLATGEQRLYGCILVKKGVIRPSA